MPYAKGKLDIKKIRRKEQYRKTVSKRAGNSTKGDSSREGGKVADSVDLQGLVTLESYKKLIARVCTAAIGNPEDGIEGVFVLFDVVAMRGGGTDELRAYVKNLALRSLVAAAEHLIPRISYELLLDDEAEQEHGKGAPSGPSPASSNKVDKRHNRSNSKPIISSNLVETERRISKGVVKLRDWLVNYLAKHFQKDPHVMVPLIAKMTSADSKPELRLIRLCIECLKLEDEELTRCCLDSFKEVMQNASIGDLDKALKVVLKDGHVHAGVLKVINGIPLIRRQHSFELLHDKGGGSSKHVEGILVAVISYYLRIIGQCSGETLEECLNGLGHYGIMVNELLQKEILGKMKDIMKKADTLKPFTHVRVLQSATMLSKSLGVKSDWILQEFTRIVPTTASYLCQGQVQRDGKLVQYSEPCYTRDVIRTIHLVLNHSISSGTSADTEDLVNFIQEVLRLTMLADSSVALSLLQEVCRAMQKAPQVIGLLNPEGMIFSVLAKKATSFWELELLLQHASPEVATIATSLKQHAGNDTLDRLKLPSNPRKKDPEAHNQDLVSSGSDVAEILLAEESELFQQYMPKDKPKL